MSGVLSQSVARWLSVALLAALVACSGGSGGSGRGSSSKGTAPPTTAPSPTIDLSKPIPGGSLHGTPRPPLQNTGTDYVAIFKSLEAKGVEVRRGAFMAAERQRDPEVISRLLDRTKDDNFETRWNAGFTVGVITSGRVMLNAFLPDAEFEKQVQDARAWLEKNRDSIKAKK